MPPDSEVWSFARTWIRRFSTANEENYAEKLIYLWVTFNAWAAAVVPDIARNHEDSYLIKCVAGSRRFQERFELLRLQNPSFGIWVDSLCDLGPIIKVLWLRNLGINQWDDTRESRRDFLERVDHHLEGTRTPPFSPKCAFVHRHAGEGIPADWPHVLSMIYQIRCNLFHGGKSYDSARDRRFIELAYLILWEMWSPELPRDLRRRRGRSQSAHPITTMPWERALVLGGFDFRPMVDGFDLSCENPQNIAYLRTILTRMNAEYDFAGSVFRPSSPNLSTHGWLQALEGLHEGAEAGPLGFTSLNLRLMDTYMGGVVRWLNWIGITTTLSCDGHGREAPWLQVSSERDCRALSACLALISAGQWRYDADSHRLISEDPNSPATLDRTWLLDLAEVLYRARGQLREFVERFHQAGSDSDRRR